ncbi:MAG: hypothetical protein V3U33_00760, partial [candidate division NC10 bacterium]
MSIRGVGRHSTMGPPKKLLLDGADLREGNPFKLFRRRRGGLSRPANYDSYPPPAPLCLLATDSPVDLLIDLLDLAEISAKP